MDEKIHARTKYLALFLLNRRMDTSKVNNWNSPIKFNVNEIKSNEFNNNKKLEQIKECLEGMKGDELQELGEVSYTVLDKFNGRGNVITITGSTTDKLLKYIRKRLCDGETIFGYSENEEKQNTISFLGDNTDVYISGKPHWIFAYMRKHVNKDVSYKKLYGLLRNSLRRDDKNFWKPYDRDDKKKLKFVNDGISQLKKLLNEAAKKRYKNIKIEVIINKRYKGEGSEGGVYKLII